MNKRILSAFFPMVFTATVLAAGTQPATKPATATAPATTAAGPVYDAFVKRYLTGDWDTLATDLAGKQKEIAALPASQAADMAYIKQALAECRPAWWDQIKQGKVTQFKQVVWKQSVQVNYQANDAARFLGSSTANSATVMKLGWPLKQMDALDPLALPQVDLNINDDFGFHNGDALNGAIWNMLGGAGLTTQLGTKKLTPTETPQFERFAGFWQNLTAAYYATPPARRLICAQSCAAFESGYDGRLEWTGRRPLGAALLIELTLHADKYKNVKVEPILGLNQLGDAHMVETFLAKPVVLNFLSGRLTLAEDRALRDLVKTLSDGNANWNVSKITLPNKLGFDLNPDKDGPLAAERVKILNAGPAKK
jgi:hypothetical protein